MERSFGARHVNTRIATPPPVELGGDLPCCRISQLVDDRLKLICLDRRLRTARLRLRRDTSELALQPHPAFHARDPDIEALTDLGVTAFSRLVRFHNAFAEFDRMRLGHASNRSEADRQGKNLDQLR